MKVQMKETCFKKNRGRGNQGLENNGLKNTYIGGGKENKTTIFEENKLLI